MRLEKHWTTIRGLGGGLLAGLSLNHGQVLFMWLGIALLWSVSRNVSVSFLWGLVAVLVSHSWLLSLHPLTWIGIPAPMSLPIAIGIWFFCGLFAGSLVCFWALISNYFLLVGSRDRDSWAKFAGVVVLSCLWGLAEVLLAHYPLFWIGVGGSVLPGDRALAGLARWFGAGGLAAIQLLIGFWLWHTFVAFQRGLGWIKPLVLGLSFVVLAHVFGSSLLIDEIGTNPIPVAFWQSDIPTRTKFSEEQQLRLPSSLQESLSKAKDLSASWLVAPEGTLNTNQELLSPAPVPLLSGGFRWERGGQRSSLLVFEKGETTYSVAVDKHRLVPLGERTPKLFRFGIRGLSAIGGLEPGDPSRLLLWSGPPAAIAICYELSDGNALANAVKNGAEWILALANLDPYPISLQKQFLAISQLRSIENSRELINVANTGPSGLILSSSQVDKAIPPFKEATELVEIHLKKSVDGYPIWTELPLVACLTIALFIRFWMAPIN